MIANNETAREVRPGETEGLLAASVQDFALIAVDDQHRVMSWNPGAERLLGYSADEILGERYDRFFTAQDVRDGVPQQELDEALRTGHSGDDRWHVRKDGSRFWASGAVTPLRDRAGRIQGFVKVFRDATEQKEAQEALREQEGLLDLAPVLVRDFDDRIVRWNRGMEYLYGWSRQEAMGKISHDLLHTRLPEPLESIRSRLLREGWWKGELTHTRRDGSQVVVASQWSLHRDGAGRPSAILEVNNDITAQKRAEESLRASEERFRATFEQAAVGLAHVGLDGRWLRVNHRLCEITGYPCPELLERRFQDITHPDDLAADLDNVHRLLAGAIRTYTQEKRYLRKDGSPVWVSLTVSLVKKPSGDPDYFIGVIEDITRQRDLEQEIRRYAAELEQRVEERTRALQEANRELEASIEALRQGEERFRTMVAEVKDYAILRLDPEGRIMTWNAGAERINGYMAEEIIGRHFSLFYPHERRERGQPELALREAAAKGRFEEESWRVRKDGSWFMADVVITPLFDESGTLRGYTKITRDITARKELERQLQQHTEELERRSRALQEANAALEAFGYSVSHDLRTPLRNMQSLAQALEEDYADRLDAGGRDFCRRITQAARKMDQLILDLLAYSRLSRTEQPLGYVDLGGVVEEARAELAEVIQERQAEVMVEKPLPAVLGHRTTLVQVMTNLLNNALKFTAPGVPPRVRVWAEDRGRLVRLWVEDNGIGIAPEHQQRIFNVFERLHGEESYPGTGIGLAIVRKGVERGGGQVGVESEVGKGSRFWVELPKPGGS